MLDIKTSADGLTFWVLIQPRASKKAVVGIHQDALKVKLTAPPVEGAANEQCIEVLAKALDRPKSTLTIVNGQTNRRKLILVRAKSGALSPEEVKALQRRLTELTKKTP
ncbi:MAG: YggU family protein [Desulfatitalea sp.]|nr:YggU family protein [Desulfatitalea sp.]MBI5894910.1 YggU family protein [Desulfobacterales bacterium]